MDEPVVAKKSPYVMQLAPGKYYWCACGRSAKQPFCDGSHKGTGINPVEFVVEETTGIALCGCKHSKDKPFCDGSHNDLG
jgi:CDGSH-type Zn-finger protein